MRRNHWNTMLAQCKKRVFCDIQSYPKMGWSASEITSLRLKPFKLRLDTSLVRTQPLLSYKSLISNSHALICTHQNTRTTFYLLLCVFLNLFFLSPSSRNYQRFCQMVCHGTVPAWWVCTRRQKRERWGWEWGLPSLELGSSHFLCVHAEVAEPLCALVPWYIMLYVG